MDYKKFWKSDSLNNIIPKGWGECPEGWNPAEFLRKCLAELAFTTVLDFGCGYGRLCEAFNPGSYTGVDLNPEAIQKARELHPAYRFQEINLDAPLPANDLLIAYTVFLHLDDEVLKATLRRIVKAKTHNLVIGEILGREWRRDGLPPVFNRSRQDYQSILSAAGYRFIEEHRRPYQRYSDNPDYQGKNTDLSVLLFERSIK